MAGSFDDQAFFNEYCKMARSSGLQYAGEWQQLEKMFPDIQDKTILDLGCGMGWHSAYFAQHGAKKIVSIDISEKMLQKAKEINNSDKISYQLCSLQDYSYPENTYDLIFSNLALHYVEDLESLYHQIYRSLKNQGVFLFNIEHPSYTAGVNQQWITNDQGQPLYWPMDNYYYPGERKTNFLGYEIKKVHHTLTQIIEPLLQMGMTLIDLQEVIPPENMRDIPGMLDEMRRPMMLLAKFEKK